jgi:two-component system LytT family response regulator
MSNKSLIISNINFAEVIQLDEIVLFVANGSYSEVILENNKRIIASKNLHWFEQKASDQIFFRVHKSYIINLLFVRKVFHNEFKIELQNGRCIPLSRGKKQELWKRLESLNRSA